MPFDLITQEEQQALDTVLERFGSDGWKKLDQIEAAMEAVPEQSRERLPLRHIFTPGLYTRECFIPKGTMTSTRIHLKEHPFVVLKGTASVWSDEDGWRKVSGPYLGVTQPGTRRLIFAHEDTVWVTFHVSDETSADEVVREVTFSEGKYEDLGPAAASSTNLVYSRKELQR